jgi:hypothetical protein
VGAVLHFAQNKSTRLAICSEFREDRSGEKSTIDSFAGLSGIALGILALAAGKDLYYQSCN